MNFQLFIKPLLLKSSKFFNSQKSIFGLATIILAICHFLKLHSNEKHSSLVEAISSSSYREVLIVSVAVEVPAALDLLMDIIFVLQKANNIYSHIKGFIARSTGLGATLICSGTLLYINNSTVPNVSLYWSLIHFEIFGLVASGLYYLYSHCEDYWTQSKISITMILIGLSNIFTVNDTYISTWKTTTGTLAIIIAIISYIFFTYQIIRWYITSLHYLTWYTITPNIACGICYLFILQIGFIGIFVMDIIFIDVAIHDADLMFCTTFQYCLIAALVLMSMIHSHGTRLKESNTLDSLKIKRMVIRYFSHEVRNPINTISLGISILQKSILKKIGHIPEDMADVLMEMLSASTTTERVLDDLLTYEKLQEKEHKLDFQSVKLWEFTKDSSHEHFAQGIRRGITLKFIEPTEPKHKKTFENLSVKADPDKLRQVLSKLVSNAIKNSPRGGLVTVRGHVLSFDGVNYKELEDPAVELLDGTMTKVFRIEITDKGKKLTQTFDELAEFDIAVLEGGQGTGLGLWICKRWIDFHEGHIGVVPNSDGCGSTYFVDLAILPDTSTLTKYISNVTVRHRVSLLQTARRIKIIQRMNRPSSGLHSSINNNNNNVRPISSSESEFRPISGQGIIRLLSRKLHAFPSIYSGHEHDGLPSGTTPREGMDASPVRSPQNMGRRSSVNVNRTYVTNTSGDLEEGVYRLDTVGTLGDHHPGPPPRLGTVAAPNKLGAIFETRETSMSMTSGQNLAAQLPSVLRSGNISNIEIRVDNCDEKDSRYDIPSSTPKEAPVSIVQEKPFIRAKSDTMISKFGAGGFRDQQPEIISTALRQSALNLLQQQPQQQHQQQSVTHFSTQQNNPVGVEGNSDHVRVCLIVDDVTSNRKMLGRLLVDAFSTFEQAEDGLEAIDVVKRYLATGHTLDVILMDFIMPNMDGPSATKEIRALGHKGLIFGVTGNAQQKDIDYFIGCGADRVFTKPLDVTELKASLGINERSFLIAS